MRKIMALGDSMTAGGEAGGGAYRSYRGYLDQQLEQAGYLVDFIGSQSHQPVDGGDPDHEGYGGRLIGPDNLNPPEIDTIYDRVVGNGFPPILPSSVDPDVIILALGWNSANYRASDAANQYERLVATVRALKPAAVLVLATLSPPEGTSEAQADVLLQGYRELNARARSLGNASASDNLLLADLARADFEPTDYVATGDIHWSRAGARRAAAVIFQALVDSAALGSPRQ
jgi:GDSL-like Lipase/Acylhydrolase family